MNRNQTDIYKGLAIFSVMFCHAAGKFGQGRFALFTPLGGIGVSIFLLLSAYGLNESWNKLSLSYVGAPYNYWWRKRFIAVWVPYIIIQFVAYWPFHKFELIPFLLDLTLIKPLYHNGWYLQYLIIWYVIFYVVRRVGVLNRYRIPVFALISVFLFFCLREIKAEQSLSFFTGIILSEQKQIQSQLFKLRYGLFFLTFGIACLAVKQLPVVRSAPQLVMNMVQLGIKLPIGLGMMILCYFLIGEMKWIGILLGAIGAISYELYLVHGYILEAVPVSVMGFMIFVVLTPVLSIMYWMLMRKVKTIWYRLLRIDKNAI